MARFKRLDYSKKEVGQMPWLVSKLYLDLAQGKQNSQILFEEAAIKYPEYFEK